MSFLKKCTIVILSLVATVLTAGGISLIAADTLSMLGFESSWLPSASENGLVSTFGLIMIALSTVCWGGVKEMVE